MSYFVKDACLTKGFSDFFTIFAELGNRFTPYPRHYILTQVNIKTYHLPIKEKQL